MFRRAIWNFLVIEKIFVTNLENYKCLYEYELPYSQEDIDKYKEEKFTSSVDSKFKTFINSSFFKGTLFPETRKVFNSLAG